MIDGLQEALVVKSSSKTQNIRVNIYCLLSIHMVLWTLTGMSRRVYVVHADSPETNRLRLPEHLEVRMAICWRPTMSFVSTGLPSFTILHNPPCRVCAEVHRIFRVLNE